MLNNRHLQAVSLPHLLVHSWFCLITKSQTLKDSEDAAHSPELGGASLRNAKHSIAHDSTAATVARKPGKSAASKRSQVAAPAADEQEYAAPDTAPPLFKRLENQKRSLSGSDSGQSDQGHVKKRRKKGSKPAVTAATAADDTEDESDEQEDEEQLSSPLAPAPKVPARKKQGKGSKVAAAAGVQGTSGSVFA